MNMNMNLSFDSLNFPGGGFLPITFCICSVKPIGLQTFDDPVLASCGLLLIKTDHCSDVGLFLPYGDPYLCPI